MSRAADRMDDVMDGREQAIDAFLTPHDADVADEIATAALQRGLRRDQSETAQIGAAANDEHFLGRNAATAPSQCAGTNRSSRYKRRQS